MPNLCVSRALELYNLSTQFLMHELSRHSLVTLCQKADDSNVLEIIAYFSKKSAWNYNDKATITVNSNRDDQQQQPRQLQPNFNSDNLLNEIIMKCYDILDSNAEKILTNESIYHYDLDLLHKILSRDTLKLSSEAVVFDCLTHWASNECQRQQKELTAVNKREVLGESLFCCRYLTMSVDEFLDGPYPSELLTEEEKLALLTRLQLQNDEKLTPELPKYWEDHRLDVVRKYVERKPSLVLINAAIADTTSQSIAANEITATTVPKKSVSKKLLNGLEDALMFVLQLLD